MPAEPAGGPPPRLPVDKDKDVKRKLELLDDNADSEWSMVVGQQRAILASLDGTEDDAQEGLRAFGS